MPHNKRINPTPPSLENNSGGQAPRLKTVGVNVHSAWDLKIVIGLSF